MNRSLLALVATIAVAAPALGLEANVATLPESWRDNFRAYSMDWVDPEEVRRDAIDGHVLLTLRDESFALTVTRAPWDASPPIFVELANGELVEQDRAAITEAFVGQIDDHPESHVLLIVTSEGVDVTLIEPGRYIYAEPLRFYDPTALPQQVVVFDAQDYIPRFDLAEDGSEDEQPVRLEIPAEEDGLGHAINPDLLVVADSYFASQWGVSTDARIDIVMNHASDTFWYEFGWWWNIAQIIKCGSSDTLCSSNWGSTTNAAATLRDNFASKAYAKRGVSGVISFDAAHLLSGRDFDGSTDGYAYLAGRYSVSQHRLGSSDHYGGLLVAHEIGHTVAGTHPNAASWTSTGYRSYYHCHSYFFGYCTSNHYHENEPYTITHYSVMHGSGNHNGDTMIWERDFTNANNAAISACNDGTWDVYLSFSPGSYPCT